MELCLISNPCSKRLKQNQPKLFSNGELRTCILEKELWVFDKTKNIGTMYYEYPIET